MSFGMSPQGGGSRKETNFGTPGCKGRPLRTPATPYAR